VYLSGTGVAAAATASHWDDTNGRLGIGTASPVTKLDVYGGPIRTYTASEVARFILGPAPSGTNLDYSSLIESVSTTASNYASTLKFYTHGSGSTTADPTLAMTINSSQQVGIGTASPAYALDIGGFASSAQTLRIAATSSISSIRLMEANDTYGFSFQNINASRLGIFRHSASSAGTEVISILRDGAGNVGIGTTSPSNKLHISAGDSSAALFGPNSTWGAYLYVGSGTTAIASGKAQCISTNGNLHLDAGNGQSIYLQGYNSGFANAGGGTFSYGTWTHTGPLKNQSQPMSMVGKNNGDQGIGFMIFNAVEYNVGGMYNSGNGRWTASVDGYYMFTYSGLTAFNNIYTNTRWYKNGGEFQWGAMHDNMGNGYQNQHSQLACSVIIFLSVNDFVQFRVITDAVYGFATLHTTATCQLIG
jgi:hypothetical protein